MLRRPLALAFSLARLLCPHFLFWGWNGLFLSVAAFGIAPHVLPAVWVDTLRGDVPMSFLSGVLALLLVPLASTAVGLVWLRRRPGALLRFFYGVEAPLVTLCLARLFLLRELNPGVAFAMGGFAVALSAYGWTLFRRPRPDHRAKTLRAGLAWAGALWTATAGLYVAALLAFYVPPAAWALGNFLLELDWSAALADALLRGRPFASLMQVLFLALFVASALLFLALPAGLAGLYLAPVVTRFAAHRARLGGPATAALAVLVPLVAVAGFVASNRQPQAEALALTAEPAVTDAERRALLERSDGIRRGLLNAYLSPHRYVSSDGENNHIAAMYAEVTGRSHDDFAGLERVWEALARPLLYRGTDRRGDRRTAQDRYEAFFDAPIQRAELGPTVQALRSTWDRDAAAAGLLDIGAENVWLEEQHVRVREGGPWAEVEIHEVYANRTGRPQEVLYYVSLPETAAVTGLWLGDTADRSKRFPFVVAPRGAAQEVYRSEVVRNVDPALLEQVGPRQYRIRAFPVPALPRRGDGARPAVSRLHLWLTYRVAATPDGWPLPQLAERRNVYWTRRSERSLGGEPWGGEDWLPATVPRSGDRGTAGQGPSRMEATMAGYRVTAETAETPTLMAGPPTAGPSTAGPRLAVVVDTSFSMTEHRGDVASAVEVLEALGVDADLYLTRAGGPPRRISAADLDSAELLFWGVLGPDELLAQYAGARREDQGTGGDDPTPYDGIFVLTDAGGYDVEPDAGATAQVPDPEAPLWWIHFGGLPIAYRDGILAATEDSGGGVATSVTEALGRLATGRPGQRIVDGWRFTIQPVDDGAERSGDPSFEAVAARQLIRHLGRSLDRSDLGALDGIHALAKAHRVVTPYSSMLVLVNDRQREALAKAEQREDRFEREAETGDQALGEPPDPFAVSGVPEPEEWALLLVAAAALVALRWRAR